MEQPKFYEYLYPLLHSCGDRNVYKTRELYTAVSKKCALTTEQMQEVLQESGQPVYKNRIGWAKTYLHKAGLLVSPRYGEWQITDKGSKWLEKNVSLTLVDLEEIAKESSFFMKNQTSVITEHQIMTPEEQMNTAFQILEKNLSEQILCKIMDNDFMFFEQLIIKLLEGMGYGIRYDNGRVMQRSNDGGIDGIINQDALGLEQIYLQAKRYRKSNNVQAPELQKFVGALAMHGASKGVFVTTSCFSSGAFEVINNIKDKSIVLIDGKELIRLMIQYNVGVRTKEIYEIKAIDEDFFIEG